MSYRIQFRCKTCKKLTSVPSGTLKKDKQYCRDCLYKMEKEETALIQERINSMGKGDNVSTLVIKHTLFGNNGEKMKKYD